MSFKDRLLFRLKVEDILLSGAQGVLSVIDWLMKLVIIVLFSFLFAFQTVNSILDVYLYQKKGVANLYLLKVGITFVVFTILLTNSMPDIWRIMAGVILAVGYSNGLRVVLSFPYIKMVGIAKKLSQSENFCNVVTVGGSGIKQLTLSQSPKGYYQKSISATDIINNVSSVESLLTGFLKTEKDIDNLEAYQKSLVAMAMIIVGCSDVTVCNYSGTEKGIGWFTPFDKGVVRLGEQLGYTIVRQIG
jgi:hypothetical protein